MPARIARARRAAYRAARRARGQFRPAEFRILVVNLDSASAGPQHVAHAWARSLAVARRNRCAAIAAVEASDADLATIAATHVRILDRGDRRPWHVTQHGHTGSPESALAIATRHPTTATRIRLHPGTPPTREGGGIRRRPVLKARLTTGQGRHRWAVTLRVGHAHPPRAPRGRARFMRVLTRLGRRGVEVGDFNLPRREVRRLLGGRVHNAGVIAASVPAWIPSSAETIPARDLGDTDHAGLLVTLWPHRAR